MLILTNPGTADKIQLVTSAAVTVDVHASYTDHTLSTDNVVSGRQNTAITTATTTDICAGPASGDVRNVKALNIRNKHASTSVDVTVVIDVSGTDYELFKVTLLAGQTLEFVEGVGFFVVAQTSKLYKNLRVTSDVVNATTSFADVTGLTWAVESGKHYNFEAHLYHVSNATTTGARFGVAGPAMTALRISGIDTVTGSVTASAHSAPTADITAQDTAFTAQTTGSANVTLAIMSGYFNPSAAGTFAVRFQSEVAVASGLTVKVGSWMQLWESDN